MHLNMTWCEPTCMYDAHSQRSSQKKWNEENQMEALPWGDCSHEAETMGSHEIKADSFMSLFTCIPKLIVSEYHYIKVFQPLAHADEKDLSAFEWRNQ